MNGKYILALVGALAFSMSASAADLLLTQGAAKRGSTSSAMAIDVVSNGDIAAFDFIIPVEKGVKVDTSKCLTNLPTGFQGACRFNGTDEVAGIVYSLEKGRTLSEGIHSFGSVVFSGRSQAFSKRGGIKFNAANTDAAKISAGVTVE